VNVGVPVQNATAQRGRIARKDIRISGISCCSAPAT
jgi:hypothetical protein